MSTVMSNFSAWKKFLGDRVEAAKAMGISEDAIAKLAYEIGEFLDNKVDPKNEEQRVLKELWDIGDESERKTMARMMVKLAERNS
ncbi:DUF3243 domain-containing protein [Cohnella lubricantis]|uniref:DUF3243 domain-containing protein n=1 Tax=Cohnella lubricantis TaxID=2163172 RepID=A0A841TF46_9BACL|nr:DUF3243 domain-containing protein [Cohnella lubricantis]MBB6679652.1 DUF3243 domain-containing protein [Cohnella lubricantis]MBP2119894.1 hypothetical protein [Cohnella lubricantis]